MNGAMLPMVRAGIDTRGDYERELERAIEARRCVARTILEDMERETRAGNEERSNA